MRYLIRFTFLPGLACVLLFSAVGCHTNSSNQLAASSAPAQSAALPASSTAADAPSAPTVSMSKASITTYSDPATGVSFQYPSGWRPLTPADGIFNPEFTQNYGPAKLVETFHPKGTPYASSNLVGMTFSYTAKTGTNAADCKKVPAAINQGQTPSKTETIHGVAYTRADGGDGATCHEMSFTVDAAEVGGKCYIFERDLETECAGVHGPGTDVALTAAQQAALQKQLDEAMASVQITVSKTH
jgi:hypothetical protein